MLEKNEILRNYRISETTLRHLIDRRILREEPRLDSLFYEIGHDTIAQSILKTRRLRLPRKYRVPAAVVAALVLIFTSYVIFANVNALQAQGKAEDARNKAEKLASYLIGEDLMGAIKPMGRMEVLEGVEKQIDEYLDSLKSSQTEKSSDLAIQIGGLAHLNRGDLAYMREEVTQEEIEYQQARGAFEQLVQRNARNPEWLHNLADAEAKLADVSSDRLQVQQSLDLYRQALSHIQTALPEVPPGKDDKLRDKLLRDEADTRQNIGADLYVQRHLDEAVTQLRQSVSLATPKGPERSTQWMYILEDGLQGEGLIFEVQGKDQEAEKAYNSALEIAERAAHKNPRSG
jgi:tetratricopeptide (TPR) repeat protein